MTRIKRAARATIRGFVRLLAAIGSFFAEMAEEITEALLNAPDRD